VRRPLLLLALLSFVVVLAGIAGASSLTDSTENSLSVTFDGLRCGTAYSASISPADSAPVSGSTKPCPPPPMADFTYSPSAPVVGQTVSFSCVTDTGVSCRWDRTNDQIPEATLPPDQPFQYAYTSSGTKTTCVQVVDAGGQASPWVCHTLTVAASSSPPPPPPPSSLLYDKTPGNGLTLAQNWPNIENADPALPPAYVSSPDGAGGQAMVLTAQGASDGMPKWSRQDTADWNNFQHDPTRISQGADTWERFEVFFPKTQVGAYYPFKPVPGDWNWFYQWHYNNTISVSGFHVEFAMGVHTDSSAANPAIFVMVKGGNVAGCTSDTCAGITTSFTYLPPNSLLFDHWYDVVIHSIWSHGSDGRQTIWLDSQQVIDKQQPTLYWRANTGENDILYPAEDVYHGPASSWPNSSTFFRRWWVGSSAASIGFTP
jgi:hypothetical protein